MKRTGNRTNRTVAEDELEAYVLNNKEIMRNLKETFYKTGKSPSEFVKIIYNFQVPNSSNSTNKENGNGIDGCVASTTTYIWSDSVLYLLGPKPLHWYTLFAVNVAEHSVFIDLPCLCNDESLLDRFTYLVRSRVCNR